LASAIPRPAVHSEVGRATDFSARADGPAARAPPPARPRRAAPPFRSFEPGRPVAEVARTPGRRDSRTPARTARSFPDEPTPRPARPPQTRPPDRADLPEALVAACHDRRAGDRGGAEPPLRGGAV